jgi:hypothetical protein
LGGEFLRDICLWGLKLGCLMMRLEKIESNFVDLAKRTRNFFISSKTSKTPLPNSHFPLFTQTTLYLELPHKFMPKQTLPVLRTQTPTEAVCLT